MYVITYKKSVEKDLRKISKPHLKKIVQAIQQLAHNPKPTASTGLKGFSNVYRLRVGDYRIVYEINKGELIVLIVRVAHRREVYKNL